MQEMPLIIFTICIQAAIGMMAFAAIAKLVNKEGSVKSVVITSAGLAVVGLLASLTHLGRPFAAINALAQFSSSWLSREIWFSSIFAGATVLTALFIFFKPTAKKAVNVLLPIAAVIGFADIFVMAFSYHSTSVQAWQHSAVFVEFYAAAVSMGAVLFIALSGKREEKLRRPLAFASGVAVIFQIAAMTIYFIQLGVGESLALQKSFSLLNSMGGVLALKWVLLILGSGLLFLPGKKLSGNRAVGQTEIEAAATVEGTLNSTACIAAALLIIGQIIGRYLFYAIMVAGAVGLY